MKIIENPPTTKNKQSALEKFSERSFTLELTGFELLALRLVAAKVGGVGKVRSVFSSCGMNIPTNLYKEIAKIENSEEAYCELGTLVKCDSGLDIDDTLK